MGEKENREGRTDQNKQVIRISVRALVEFVLRCGDLDNRRGGFAEKDAMQKGSRIHRKIQKQMGSGYRSEVALSHTVEYEDDIILLEGRADGILDRADGVVIDEIKSVYRPLRWIEEPKEVHLAQAKCYAYIYGRQRGCRRITIWMTYCNLQTEDIRRFEREYDMETLETWFGQVMDTYAMWIRWERDWKRMRDASMHGLEFPFAYRDGQRDVVAGVYRTILRRKQLFLQAPTGVGKTMSTIFPAVRALGEGIAEKVFYLTAKTITRKVAWEALELLQTRGLKCKTIVLTAKEKLCVCEEMDCNPANCPRAKGHFDRVNAAVLELLQEDISYDRETILRSSEKHQVCPYEMSLDLAVWMDVIICDYNYVFDPQAQLKRFFSDKKKESYVFLIDEAHNLVERGRDMYSAILYKEEFLRIKNLVKSGPKTLERALERCNRQLLELKRECENGCKLDTIGSFSLSLVGLLGELENILETQEHGYFRKELLEFYFQVNSFLGIYNLLDENYVIYSHHDTEGRFGVKLYCVNPAANLQRCMDKGSAAVFFSATFLPIRYYKTLLSTRTDDYAIYARSPFDPSKMKLFIARDVSSRYSRRNAQEYYGIADYIHQVISVRQGNYMIFFPSYKMMEDVYAVYEENFQFFGIRVLLQQPNMREDEKEAFLQMFEQEGQYLLGFCVMGGIFSEGIDLVGEKLVGAVIVGTGLPQIGYERELLREFYEARGENGFDYAYRFPGMNKVLQSAGRVIRTQDDRGVIVLLDERFGYAEYKNLFPREWSEYSFCSRSNVRRQVEAFWNGAAAEEVSSHRDQEDGV